MIIYGRGPESEDTATRLEEQCTAHRVWSELTPIDEVNQNDVRPGYFTGLVAVLPSQVTNPTADLQPFSDLIGHYRARRPERFESIRTRGRAWFYAGVVHLVGEPEIIQNPLLVATLDFVCAQHRADDSDPINIFQLYTRPFPILTEQSNESDSETMEKLLRDVQNWGIARDDVPKLRKCIDDCRERFENYEISEDKPHYPALFRPLQPDQEIETPDLAWKLNMLDIILVKKESDIEEQIRKCVDHMTETEKAKFRKAFKESGARVYRTVMEELRKIVPELARPHGREGKKDAQKDLRRLYRDLQIIDRNMNSLDIQHPSQSS